MTEKKDPIATVQLHKSTKERLEKMKEYPRETYEDVILRVIRANENHKLRC